MTRAKVPAFLREDTILDATSDAVFSDETEEQARKRQNAAMMALRMRQTSIAATEGVVKKAMAETPAELEIRRQIDVLVNGVASATEQPDQIAQEKQVAKDLGVPEWMVSGRLNEAQGGVNAQRQRELMDRYLPLGDWARNNPRDFAMGFDDHEAIGEMGRLFTGHTPFRPSARIPRDLEGSPAAVHGSNARALVEGNSLAGKLFTLPYYFGAAQNVGTKQLLKSTTALADLTAEKINEAFILGPAEALAWLGGDEEARNNVRKWRNYFKDENRKGLASQQSEIDEAMSEFRPYRDPVVLDELSKKPLLGKVTDRRWLANTAFEGVSNLPTTAAAAVATILTKNPYVGALMLGSAVTADAYYTGLSKGLTEGEALIYGFNHGVPEALFEISPMGAILEMPAKTFMGGMAKYAFKEGGGEAGTTVFGSFTDWAMLPENRDKTVGDWAATVPEDVVRTLLAVATTAPFITGAVKSLPLPNYYLRQRRKREFVKTVRGMQAALQGEALFSEVERIASTSKLKKRDRLAFARLTEALAEKAGVSTVYIPADKVAEFMASDAYDGKTSIFAREAGVVSEAVAVGGDLAIPAGVALGIMPGTPEWAALKPHMRTEPGGMSMTEAEEVRSSGRLTEVTEEDMAELQKVMADLTDDEKEVHDRLVENTKKMFEGLGFTEDVQQASAELFAANQSSRAKAMGQPLSDQPDAKITDVVPPELAAAIGEGRIGEVIQQYRQAEQIGGFLASEEGQVLAGLLSSQAELPEGTALPDGIDLTGILDALQPGITQTEVEQLRKYLAVRDPTGDLNDQEIIDLLQRSMGRDEGSKEGQRQGAKAATASDEPTDIRGLAQRPGGRGERGGDGADQRAPDRTGSPLPQALLGATKVGGEVFGPIPEIVALAEAYADDNGIPYRRQGEWVTIDEGFSKRLADAYEAMEHDPDNPEVIAAYDALIRETRAQYDALVDAGYSFTFYDVATNPYSNSPWDAIRDLRDNKRMAVFSTAPFDTDFRSFGSGEKTERNLLETDTGLEWPDQNGVMHPVLANDMFRAVHDAFGHGLEGAGFRAEGEENAWQAHARLYSAAALPAVTNETRGQNSWVNFGPKAEANRTASQEATHYADQKNGMLPAWTWTERVAPDAEEGGNFNSEEERLRQSAAPLQTNPLAVAGTSLRAGRVMNWDLAEALTKRHMDEYGRTLDPINSPEDRAIVLASLIEDYRDQLAQPNTGATWYSDDIAEAIEVTTQLIPELANPVNRDLFLTIAALLSPQQAPVMNWDNAVIAMQGFLTEGSIPTRKPNGKQFGVASHTTGLQLLQHLIDRHGLEGALSWVRTPKSGREIAETRRDSGLFTDKPKLAGYLANETNLSGYYMGIYMMGPKVGDFMQNSVGLDHSAVTIDLWAARTYNRLIGRLTDVSPKQRQAKKIASELRGKAERDAIKSLIRDAAKEAGIDPSAMQAALWYFEQRLYLNHGIRTESQSFSGAARRSLAKRGITFRSAEGGVGASRQAAQGGIRGVSGEVAPDLARSLRQGGNVTDLDEVRRQKQLERFHERLRERLAQRSVDYRNAALRLREEGKLPFEVGTRFFTPKSREQGVFPWIVRGYYADPKDPERYGYHVERGIKDQAERTILMVSDPKADAIMRESNPEWDRAAHVAQWTELRGPVALNQRPINDVFRDGLVEAIKGVSATKAPAKTWLGTLRGAKGVKEEALYWSGVLDWLRSLEETMVEKADILRVAENGGFKLRETIYGEIDEDEVQQAISETRASISEDFDNNWLPTSSYDIKEITDWDGEPLAEPKWSVGGVSSGYIWEDLIFDTEQEALEKAQELEDEARERDRNDFMARFFDEEAIRARFVDTNWRDWSLTRGDFNATYRELAIEIPETVAEWSGQHSGFQNNAIAHVRFFVTKGADGKIILFIEEIQSDWHARAEDVFNEAKTKAVQVAWADFLADNDPATEEGAAIYRSFAGGKISTLWPKVEKWASKNKDIPSAAQALAIVEGANRGYARKPDQAEIDAAQDAADKADLEVMAARRELNRLEDNLLLSALEGGPDYTPDADPEVQAARDRYKEADRAYQRAKDRLDAFGLGVSASAFNAVAERLDEAEAKEDALRKEWEQARQKAVDFMRPHVERYGKEIMEAQLEAIDKEPAVLPGEIAAAERSREVARKAQDDRLRAFENTSMKWRDLANIESALDIGGKGIDLKPLADLRSAEDKLDDAGTDRRLRRAEYGNLLRGGASIPDAPFKGEAWVELVLKRMIAWAVDEGYDQIAWIKQGENNGGRTPDDNVAWFYERNLINTANKLLKPYDAKVRGLTVRGRSQMEVPEADALEAEAQGLDGTASGLKRYASASEEEAREWFDKSHATMVSAVAKDRANMAFHERLIQAVETAMERGEDMADVEGLVAPINATQEMIDLSLDRIMESNDRIVHREGWLSVPFEERWQAAQRIQELTRKASELRQQAGTNYGFDITPKLAAAAQEGFLRQGRLIDDVFYSGLRRAVENIKAEKAPASAWLDALRNAAGAKKEEMEATGITAWLEGMTEAVTKQQVLAFIDAYGVEVVVGFSEKSMDIYEVLDAYQDEIYNETYDRARSSFDEDDFSSEIIEDDTPSDVDTATGDLLKPDIGPPYMRTEPGKFSVEITLDNLSGYDDDEIAEAVGGEELEADDIRERKFSLGTFRSQAEANRAISEAKESLWQHLLGLEYERPYREDVENEYIGKYEGGGKWRQYTTNPEKGENYVEMEVRLPFGVRGNQKATFPIHPHFSPDTMAFAQLDERISDDGADTLAMHANQSDVHEQGMKQGYNKELSSEERVRLEAERQAATDEGTTLRATPEYAEWEERHGAASSKADLLLERSGDFRRAFLSFPHLLPASWAVGASPEAARVALSQELSGAELEGALQAAAGYRAAVQEYEDAKAEAEAILRERPHSERLTELANIEASIYTKLSGSKGVPDVPFKGTAWAALVLRAAIRHAIDRGMDRIVWIHGYQQNGNRNEKGAWFYDGALINVANEVLRQAGVDTRVEWFDVSRLKINQAPIYSTEEPSVIERELEQFDADNAEKVAELEAKIAATPKKDRGPLKQELGKIKQDRGKIAQKLETAINERREQFAGFNITPELIEAANKGFPLFQNQKEAPPRAEYDNINKVIRMFEDRDVSSIIHEFSHHWLERLYDMADAGVEEAMKHRANLEKWFTEHGALAPSGKITVKGHELFARAGERYFMEGKAPTPSLQRAFDAFRGWLLDIYKSIKAFNAPINNDVRAVFDYMLTADGEVQAALEMQGMNAHLKDAAIMGMGEQELSDFGQLVKDAEAQAQADVLEKAMKPIRAARRKHWRDLREATMERKAEEVSARPLFRALDILRTTQMNADLLEERFPGALKDLPVRVPPLATKAGEGDPEVISEMAGFKTAKEMIRVMKAAAAEQRAAKEGGDKRSLKQRTIETETDAELTSRYGDPLNDGTIEEEASAVVSSQKQGEVLASKLRYLGNQIGKKPTPYSVAREFARRRVRGGTYAAEASPAAIQMHARNVAKAGKLARDALIAGDREEAFRRFQQQMLSSALLQEAKAANNEVNGARARMTRYATTRTIKSVDQAYLEQAQALLEAVDMKQRSQKSIDRANKFFEWAKAQEEAGFDVVVPENFEAMIGSTHWSRLPIEHLLALDEAIKQIIHLGRLKQSLIDKGEKRTWDEIRREAEAAGDRIGRDPPDPENEGNKWWGPLKQKVLAFDAALLKMEQVFSWLDSGDPNGVFTRIAFRPIAEAQQRERDMLDDYYARIKSLMDAVPEGTLKSWANKMDTGLLSKAGKPLVLRRDQIVSMALNWGNEGNRQRLVEGRGWNREAVEKLLMDTLTKEEWVFVQGVWDVLETLWPDIAALERKVNGVEPERVEAADVVTPHGTFRGGYYPAIYDSRLSYVAEEHDAETVGRLFSGAFTKATTRASSTKDRANKVNRPILLDLGVINRHMGEVIHDITHREAVMQAWRFLTDPKVMAVVDDTLGPEVRKLFRPWVQNIANSWAMERAGNEAVGAWVSKLRANATAVGMGFRFTTMLMQVAGYSNSAEYVGGASLAKAMAQTSAHPIETFRFVLERSAEVRQRLETLDRDLRQEIDRINADPLSGAMTDAKRFAFQGIGLMDRMVVVPTWLAEYNNRIADGLSEEDAAYAADKAVRLSQGSGATKDLAMIASGRGRFGEILKVMTMFYSYLSTVYNRQRTLYRDARSGDASVPEVMARAWWLIVVPPLLSELLKMMIGSGGPDDDEGWAWWVVKKMIGQSLGAIPFVRDAFEPAWDALAGNKGFGYRFTPLQAAGESAVNTARDIGKVLRGEDTKRMTRNTLETVGYFTGLPLGYGQVATAIQFWVDVAHDEQDPENLGDYVEGTLSGRVKE